MGTLRVAEKATTSAACGATDTLNKEFSRLCYLEHSVALYAMSLQGLGCWTISRCLCIGRICVLGSCIICSTFCYRGKDRHFVFSRITPMGSLVIAARRWTSWMSFCSLSLEVLVASCHGQPSCIHRCMRACMHACRAQDNFCHLSG